MQLEVHLASLAECSAEHLVYGDAAMADLPISTVIPWRVDELAILGELLDLGSRDSIRARFSLEAGESQGCPWVISFPSDLAEAIVELDGDQIASLAAGPAPWIGQESGSVRQTLHLLSAFFKQHSAPYALYVTTPRD